MVFLINGKMRTPKVEALHRLIVWLNMKANLEIPLLGLDLSNLDSNSWLAGMCDGYSNFQIALVTKINGVVRDVKLYFRLELRQEYHRESSLTGTSYKSFMQLLADFLGVNLLKRTRIIDNIERSFLFADSPLRVTHPECCQSIIKRLLFYHWFTFCPFFLILYT